MLKTDKPLRHDDDAAQSWPKADLSRLTALEPGLVAAVYLAAAPNHETDEASLAGSLVSVLGGEEHASSAIASAVSQSWLSRQDARITLTEDGHAALAAKFGAARLPDNEAAAEKLLAAMSLGFSPDDKATMRYLGKRENLETAALAKLFISEGLPEKPSRSAFRFAFMKIILTQRFAEYAPQLTAATPRNYRTNSLINALVQGVAGKSGASIEEAEREMLHNALGMKRGSKLGLAGALIRTAAAPKLPKDVRIAQPKPSGITEFSAQVKRIAKTMVTEPYKGRVAIAQVYDAGLAQGLDFGSLDEFKARIVEACRSGLLDLERYDIAGPLDPSLRERSRTPFGRDERHFIVNQWT